MVSWRSECWPAACRGNCPAGHSSRPRIRVRMNLAVTNKAVGEIVNQKLLSGMTGQIAQRRDGHGNAQCQTRPLLLRFHRFSGPRGGLPWCPSNVGHIQRLHHYELYTPYFDKASKSRQIRAVPSVAFSSGQHGRGAMARASSNLPFVMRVRTVLFEYLATEVCWG